MQEEIIKSSMVDDTDDGNKNSDDLEKAYDSIANLNSTGSDNVVGDSNSVH